MDHGLGCCVGFRIERGGHTIVYAADTRPCANVVEHAKGADLLIHEVYRPEVCAKEAYAFGHPTAAGAGRVARDSGAKRLILTHFRAHHLADPRVLISEAEAAFGSPVESARDLATFAF